MNGSIFLLLSAVVLAAEASLPHGLRKFLETSRLADENATRMTKLPKSLSGPSDEFDDAKLAEIRSSIEEAVKNYDAGDVHLYTPKPIKEAECYVEFQVPRRVPGRCIKLAGVTPACQTDTYLSPNHHMCS